MSWRFTSSPYSGRCLFGVTQSEWRDVVYVIIFVGKGGRFKLQSNKDIRFTTLARCLVFFFRARCWGQEVVGWNPAGKEECQDESKLSLAAAAAAAAAVSDLAFVREIYNQITARECSRYLKWITFNYLVDKGEMGMKRQEWVWMCFIFCEDKPCLCAISLELLNFLKSLSTT